MCEKAEMLLDTAELIVDLSGELISCTAYLYDDHEDRTII
jgi:hypothetical protein